MLTGQELGNAIRAAIKKKGVTQREVARVFNVKPPSVQDWMKRGTVSKDKLLELWVYFQDVAGPEHWGMSAFPSWETTRNESVTEPPPSLPWPLRSVTPQQIASLSAEEINLVETFIFGLLRLPPANTKNHEESTPPRTARGMRGGVQMIGNVGPSKGDKNGDSDEHFRIQGKNNQGNT